MKKERIQKLGLPSFMALNSYIQEVQKNKESGRGVKVEIHNPVNTKEFPDHLGTKVNVLV